MKMKFLIAALILIFCCICHANMLALPEVTEGQIRIDGEINSDEYAKSSMLGGMVHYVRTRMIPRDVEVYLASSPEKLYLAVRTPVEDSEPGGGLIANATQTGGAVYSDDCVEFFIGDGKNNIYQLLFNRLNTRLEMKYVNRKSTRDWHSGVESASTINKGFWVLEAAIPWKNLSGVNPAQFRFNAARNFVSAGFGYGNLTGQRDVLDQAKMFKTRVIKNFGGVRVYGADTSLVSGSFLLRCEGDAKNKIVEGNIYEKRVIINRHIPGKIQTLPHNGIWKFLSYQVHCQGSGIVCWRTFFPFEMGRQLSGAPVSGKYQFGQGNYAFVRHYPSYNKVAVLVSLAGNRDKKVEQIEIISPDGKSFKTPASREPDGTWKAMIELPVKRAFGIWNGNLTIVENGKTQIFKNAFRFEEKNFPWLNNQLGYSNKILSPFTPIVVNKEQQLSTLLRTHTLSKTGLIDQVKSKNEEILSSPLSFELVSGGKKLTASKAALNIVKAEPHQVLTVSSAKFGNWDYRAETAWDYDGFAFVNVKLTPPAKEEAQRLTLAVDMKAEHASLFHALVDAPRGNPAGLIPKGKGVVWNSGKLLRMKNQYGLPNVPGEFTPYAWFGAEERGLCFLFDSPKGFDLEDGKPMIRLVRKNAETVTMQCDIVNRNHGVGKAIEFSFGFQVTPVKTRMKGWENWVYTWGSKLPGMLHILPIGSLWVAGGMFPDGFRKIPYNNDYSYTKTFKNAMKNRRIPYEFMKKFHEKDSKALDEYASKNAGFLRKTFWKSPERFVRENKMYLETQFQQMALTLDRVCPYNCASIIAVSDPAWQFHKAEWATRQMYQEGLSDRIYMTPRAVDYLLWTYDKLLEAGADGINFDETFPIPQTNPDLAACRDYKNRPLPTMGILASRQLFKRLAYIMESHGKKERLIAPHLTNTMIIPEFAFATLSICWEYSVPGNFIEQFPPDYIRAHSTGLQAGLVPVALVLPTIPNRAKLPLKEYYPKYDRAQRTALGLLNQHRMFPMQKFWGNFNEPLKDRYLQWAFGTHKPDCRFLPYYQKNNPFKVSENYLVSCYQRGRTALFIITNCGKAGTTTFEFDRKKMGIVPDGVVMDPVSGETFEGDKITLTLQECDFRYIFVGSPEFGAMLQAPEPDNAYIRK